MKNTRKRTATPLGLLFIATLVTICAAGDQLEFDPEKMVRTDAKVQLIKAGSGQAFRVETGTTQPWPGITLPLPKGEKDLSAFAYVQLQVRNSGTEPVTVSCRIDNDGADGTNHCVTGHVKVIPGDSQPLRVVLRRNSGDTLDGKLFGMRGYPVAPGGERTIDPSKVTQLLVFIHRPAKPHRLEISEIRAAGTWTPPTASTADAAPFLPFIDTFGQYRHKDWPGKIHSVEELRNRRQLETEQLVQDVGPEDWNQYGGWLAGPQLEASGFFRVEKYRGKWWLIDPEGRLFWSHGIDCVRMIDSTTFEERADWFENFPGLQPGFKEFSNTSGYASKGYYAGRTLRCFSFTGANLKRKYGEDWRRIVPGVIHRRLRHWGLNTIGNWSEERLRLVRRTPYLDTISSGRTPDIEGSEGYWGKFPDVFDPRFETSLRNEMAARAGRSANDPWCIGYFSDNEMSWGDELSLGLATLRSPGSQAAKKAFAEDLRAKYGEVSGLNRAWGSHHASWEALLKSQDVPPLENARGDLEAFYTRIAENYFTTVRRVIREIAPKQLYLGCRFSEANDRAAAAAAKYCDVVSHNLYKRSVADFTCGSGADVPLIIGEFHFGALDRGLFHTGLVPVENQQARAEAYREYVEGALRHPHFVGCHWFQYQDEPTTGRVSDEENYQIGFIDVADSPHAETVAASRSVGANLYQTRLGNE